MKLNHILLFLCIAVLKNAVATTDDCADLGKLQCQDGSKCYTEEERCDRYIDCHDESDEHDCPLANVTCPDGDFLCSEDNLCIPQQFVCDGGNDCSEGSDEVDCLSESSGCELETDFQCLDDERCINKMLVCDGVPHCLDSSDERNCHPEALHGCDTSHQFDCGAGNATALSECIASDHVCDSIVDCSNGKDEANCSIDNCGVNNGNCEQLCRIRQVGYHCDCYDGYRIAFDHMHCEDIDECVSAEALECSHFCHNTMGGYYCSCLTGYRLASDNKTCVAVDDTDAVILIAANDSLLQYNVHTKHKEVLMSWNNAIAARSIDIDYRRHSLFWIDSHKHSINRMQLNGTVKHEQLVIAGVYDPTSVAYDWIHGNVYWADRGNSHHPSTISVLTLARNIRLTLLRSPIIDSPTALAVDPRPMHRIMYWGQAGTDKPGIYQAGLDGSSVSCLDNKDVTHPSSISIDMVSNRIIWVDSKQQQIFALDLTTKQHDVLHDIEFSRHPVGRVVVFEDWLYWSDSQSKAVFKLHRYLSSEHDPEAIEHVTELGSLHHVTDVQVYSKLHQVLGTDQCEHSACSHACLPSSSLSRVHWSCFCPEDDNLVKYSLQPNGTCLQYVGNPTTHASVKAPQWLNKTSLSPTTLSNYVHKPLSFSTTPAAADGSDDSTSVGVWVAVGIGITLLIVVMILAGLVVYRLYKHSKHLIKLNTSSTYTKSDVTVSDGALQVPLASHSTVVEDIDETTTNTSKA